MSPAAQPSGTGPRTGKKMLKVLPVRAHGRFDRLRRIVFLVLMALLVAAPFIPLRGRPAIWLDVPQRRFHVLTLTFNAQDTYLLFFALAGLALSIVVLTTLLGRVWCGFACPQTVFLEGLYRPIEKFFVGEGSKIQSAPWHRKLGLQLVFVVLSLLLAHAFVAYFIPHADLWRTVRQGPWASPTAFAWVATTTAIFYGNFAFFREQTCIVVCPYGRMQSVLFDRNTLLVGYDVRRGEPRGKVRKGAASEAAPALGDCVDCGKCVRVCPTGIDIRNGLQIECLACTACIDACDSVMDALHRPRGLIRYDSQASFEGEPRRILRPRLALYAGLLTVGLGVAFLAFSGRTELEANLLRQAGTPYIPSEHGVRNGFKLHLVSKSDEPMHIALNGATAGYLYTFGSESFELAPFESKQLPLFVEGERPSAVRVRIQYGEEAREVEAQFLAPQGRP